MRRTVLVLAIGLAAGGASAQQAAIYRASGADARLFDQYDNDGFSLEVGTGAAESVELRVRVSDSPLASAVRSAGLAHRPGAADAPDRDASRAARAGASQYGCRPADMIGLYRSA